jgi:hypothetical protein
MSDHKFKIGQTVNYKPRMGPGAGVCTKSHSSCRPRVASSDIASSTTPNLICAPPRNPNSRLSTVADMAKPPKLVWRPTNKFTYSANVAMIRTWFWGGSWDASDDLRNVRSR